MCGYSVADWIRGAPVSMHTFEIRLRKKDKRGVDLISDALPFGRLWYGGPNAISNAVGYAMHYSRSDDAKKTSSLSNGNFQLSAARKIRVPKTRSTFHPHAQRNVRPVKSESLSRTH